MLEMSVLESEEDVVTISASEKMARRVELVELLTQVDFNLKLVLGLRPSNRVTADVRELLSSRRAVCSELRTVGYHFWPVPVSLEESKVV